MTIQEQRTHEVVKAFLIDRKAQNLTSGTIRFYKYKLKLFIDYCDLLPSQITPSIIREYLIYLSQNHNPGGVHDAYRALKTMFTWYENEVEDFNNPFNKIKPPKNPSLPLEPVELNDVIKLLSVSGIRDSCIFMILLDSGVRASELLSIDVSDVNLLTGAIMIRNGKGHKHRTVFVGLKSRKSLRKYLKSLPDTIGPLFRTDDGNRLTYLGLRSIIARRSKDADISPPPIHSFRRAFCLNMLREGCDLASLASLMGHSSLSTLHRYLKQTNEDVRLAHKQFGVVDNRLYG